ncbi:sigma-70 family RNA polymerase sigma factor [bacterium]|nr:sigma-70 family RNA polymerase sigma factor [bacterium]NDC95659.1 sigma-70 family RNA polymerase sigma factor [bacterium]NDD85361.1 sigma-70 family RNA polymerase sigma factor [bacterium]
MVGIGSHFFQGLQKRKQMLLQINGIGDQKLEYKDHSTIKFDNLKTYLLLAKKAISKFGPKFYNGLSTKMLKDEDAIASIANAIMMADWRWDENRSGLNGAKKTKYSYRNQCALWAMQTYVSKDHKRSKKIKAYSLDYIADDDKNDFYTIAKDTKVESPDNIVMKNEEFQNLTSLIDQLLSLDSLTERQKDYIRLYYFESYTFEQIGKKYGITREAVRQGLNKALNIVRGLLV